MDRLKGFLAGVMAIATPENLATAKRMYLAFATLWRLKHDDGTDITAAELDALWDEAAANFQTLRDEARASNATIGQ
jgi:hypothetical protein